MGPLGVPIPKLLSPRAIPTRHTVGALQEQFVTPQDRQTGVQNRAGKLIVDLQIALGYFRQHQLSGALLQMRNSGFPEVDNQLSVSGSDMREVRRVHLMQTVQIDAHRRHTDTTHRQVVRGRQLVQEEVLLRQTSTLGRSGGLVISF